MTKLLSIIIATRNREYYCIEAIKSILALNSDCIEICVADNSESDEVEDFVKDLNSDIIRYIHNREKLTFIENFNFAVGLAQGTYLVNIGDDDSILPEIINVVQWANENNVDTITPKNTIAYYWPNADKNFPLGYMTIPFYEKKLRKADSKGALKKLLENGIVNYMFYDVPKIYHGIVKRDIMEKIKNITGSYFGGLSPDIFSVICIALITSNHYVMDSPLTIAGVCPSSGSADQLKGKHCGELSDMPHIQNRKEPYQWDKDIPEFYSVTTIWGDSGLNAIDSMKFSEFRKYFNVYPLIAQALLMNRNQILQLMLKKAEKLRTGKGIGKLSFWSGVIFNIIKQIINKIQRVYTEKMIKRTTFVNEVNDIHKAISIFEKSVQKNK
ncbi:glycosyltransferase family 2 protein [Chryseobacterium paridis]|uniref:Glycosyltransferase family 2 protein n=1 Tax=Chryseobacterium paridis TaxID=2800328 RepID=A0ABS1FZ28_9FLAO|nr:glycosyltransferase family 2 protein [Chryseobacterium paridis]MBK1897707.1 glycosyltransferase family 2 protein [Chryseobacterium paridis]